MKPFRVFLPALCAFTLFATPCPIAVAAPPIENTAPPIATSGERPYDFYGRGPFRDNVPKPSVLLGYEAGQTHSTFRDQERVFLAIADAAKDRVRVVEYGKSVEGRPLRLFIVGTPENIAKLDEIRTNNLKLADPRKLASQTEENQLIANAPAILWLNECIHGDETASFEAAMWTFYTLAASENPQIEALRKNAVVILNPVFNPDGHERFVVWYNSVALGNADGATFEKNIPWALRGRFNHYRFDMNRDRVAQSQIETRQETAAQLSWHPQVYIDQHGQPPVYFFPPNAEATNINVDPKRVTKWTEIFGKANAAGFDGYGWNYVVRETYDFFAPVYLDSFATLSGAIGMTYETDGGGNLARKRDDGTISTLRDAVAHHMETALTTLQTAASRHEELLHDFAVYRHKAIDEGKTGKLRRVIIPASNDMGRMAEFAALLNRVGVEAAETTAPFDTMSAHSYMAKDTKAVKRTFPAGSLIVEMSQPQGFVAKAFLEPDAQFDPAFVKAQIAKRDRNEKRNENEAKEGYEFYDITAWSLPLAFAFDAAWTEDAPPVATKPLTFDMSGTAHLTMQTGGVSGGRATVAYLIRPDRDAAFVLGLRLLKENFRLAALTKSANVGGKEWPAGTLIARVGRNPESLHGRVAELAAMLGVDVTALNNGFPETGAGLGSDNVMPLRKPRIAVAADEGVQQTGYGAVWYVLETIADVPFTAIRARNLPNADLSRFNAVILPDGNYGSALGKAGASKLRDFASNGGAVVGLGGGGTWFADKDTDLTSARAVGEDDGKDDKKIDAKDEKKSNKKPQDLPGSIFRATIDPTHFLGWGYPQGEIAVPLAGSTFLKPSKTGTNVITFGKAARLSGFVWDGNTEPLLEGTAFAIDEPIGSGHALLFLDDPTQRAQWPGLRRLFLSALLYGTAGSPAD